MMTLPFKYIDIKTKMSIKYNRQGNVLRQSLSMIWDRSVVFPVPPVSSINKTDRHDMTEILLKVALTTNKQTNKHMHR
jgi:hypothetical protein